MTAGPAGVPVDSSSDRWKRVLKRVLQLSFLFFLIKGMAWLVVGWLAWKGLS